MDRSRDYKALKKFCQEQGLDLFGVADINKVKHEFMLSQDLLDKISRAVCVGARLSAGVLEEIKDVPTRLYYYHYKTINALLDQAAIKISNYIQRKGYLGIPIPASQVVDWQNQKAHLSHKRLGVLSGIGWIGRSNLLVNQELGSQFRLATILTDMPLKADKPLQKDCGNCKACIIVCPAQAIKENPLDFDHVNCFEKLKEFQKQRVVDQYICGVCVNVCRGNR